MLNFFLILNTISIMFKNRSLDQQKKKIHPPSFNDWVITDHFPPVASC